MEVDLTQDPDLGYALLVGGDLTVNSDSVVTAENAAICVNGTFDNQGATTGDVEAKLFSGNAVVGTETLITNNRILPSSDPIFNYYTSRGTLMTPTPVLGETIITTTVLSPNSSWTGDLNPDGIYVIDSQGNDVRLAGCRIVGTIVVTNLSPGKCVKISSRINWEPAHPNYPALLVDGDVRIEMQDGELTEWFLTPTFNPVGTPYKGEEDTDKNDSFYSSIAGLIYCTGNLEFNGSTSSDRFPDLRGQLIVGGNCTLVERMLPTIKYNSLVAMDPPPGFGSLSTTDASAASLLKSYSGSGNTDQLVDNKWWAQYLKPTLPADAVSWRVTRAEFYCDKGNGNRDFDVVLYAPDGSNMPSTTVIDSVAANSNDFSNGPIWQGVDFTGTATIPAGDGVCLALETTAGGTPMNVDFLNSGVTDADSAMITGNPTWQTYDTDKALLCRVYGVYYTASGVAKPLTIEPGTWRQVESE